MKKTLLFGALLVSTTFFGQTNLVLNGSCDEHISDTNDNADAWDMTPNSSLEDGAGNDISSPYRAIWNNTALASWLETNCGDGDEQPGSTSDGQWDYSAGADKGVKTRGVKIGESCRRLYQVVAVTPGKEYTFTIDSRSEVANVPSEVFILNTEIITEAGLSSASGDVDGYFEIVNDFNASKSNATTNNFTTSTFDFTASGSKIVIYVRASLAISSSHEVFYDNISLVEKATASVDEVFSSKTSLFPNPATQLVNISSDVVINKVEVYNVLGKKVLSTKDLTNKTLDISSLSSGIYMVKLTSGNSVALKKLIKK